MNPDTDHILSFTCAACQSPLTVPAALAGVTGPCPICREMITAPDPGAVAPPLSPPGASRPSGSPPLRVDGPPEKASIFTKVCVALFLLLIASPFLIFGGMLLDMKGQFDDKQAAHESSEEYQLINVIDQIVHPKDPKWQAQGGADVTQGAILLERTRMLNQDQVQTGKPFDISMLMGGGTPSR